MNNVVFTKFFSEKAYHPRTEVRSERIPSQWQLIGIEVDNIHAAVRHSPCTPKQLLGFRRKVSTTDGYIVSSL